MSGQSDQRPLIIFHHPGPVSAGGRSGSQVRPWQLLQAFTEEGYDVVPVVGSGAARQEQVRVVFRAQKAERRIAFVYSESRSIPTLLSEPNRIPAYPFLDFRFLLSMRKAGVPVGLFYRDVFWRFRMYRTMLAWPGRAVTIPLYHYDWWWYRRVVNHLFLPSCAMSKHLPSSWSADRLSALPPGTMIESNVRAGKQRRSAQTLALLYVGGVLPPSYDLSPLLAIVRTVPDVRLTLCCRAEEWESVRSGYAEFMSERVEIVHVKGEALRELYAKADLFALIRKPHEYLDFAVPVKLLETVGFGVPIVTLAGTEAARIVAESDLGWTAPDAVSMVSLLKQLRSNPLLLAAKRESVRRAQAQHTWSARVQEIAAQLHRYDRRQP